MKHQVANWAVVTDFAGVSSATIRSIDAAVVEGSADYSVHWCSTKLQSVVL